jgi:hypothetical protein
MEFTKELFLKTKENHIVLDKHLFIKCILNGNVLAFDNYIQFHYIVFDKIQSEFEKYNLPLFFKGLLREIPLITLKNKSIDDYILKMNVDNLQQLLVYTYMFYLGILKGGSILKKHFPNTKSKLFLFNDRELIINELKKFLDNNIINKQKFIDNVNENYIQINYIFNSLKKSLTSMDDSL